MMNRKRRLIKLLYDWMGVLCILSLVSLAVTGEWVVEKKSAYEATSAISTHVPVIVVDAGHGDPDGGAVGAGGVVEAGLNLNVAKMVESGLKEAGFKVVMTREGDGAIGKNKQEDMQARRSIMRQEDVSAIVSVHMNKWRDRAIHGPMAFYMKGSAEGERLATAVISAVCSCIGHDKRPANPGDYFVIRESIAPAVIIECGFLSNPEDAAHLQDETYQCKLAEGIVAGIAAYFAAATPSPEG